MSASLAFFTAGQPGCPASEPTNGGGAGWEAADDCRATAGDATLAITIHDAIMRTVFDVAFRFAFMMYSLQSVLRGQLP